MGEYLNNVKLGTCENLYYTTFEQLKNWKVSKKEEFLKVNSGYRFRFPFPDEKSINIGNYENYDRGYIINIPVKIFEMNHDKKFLRTDTLGMKGAAIGFSIDCPTTFEVKYRWENSYLESYEILQQKYVTDEETGEEELQTVLRCPYCGSSARANKIEATKISDYLLSLAEKYNDDEDKKQELIEIAQTIIAGYNLK